MCGATEGEVTEKPVVEVKSIEVRVGNRTLTLTLEEAKELRRVLDDVLKRPAPATPLQLPEVEPPRVWKFGGLESVNIPSVWCEDDLKNIPLYTVETTPYEPTVTAGKFTTSVQWLVKPNFDESNVAVARDTDIGDVYLVQAGGAK